MPKMQRKDGENGDYFDGGLTKSCNFANDMPGSGKKGYLLIGVNVEEMI